MKHLLLALCFLFTLPSFAVQSEAEADGSAKVEIYDPGKVIMEHVADDHEWHFATLGNEHTGTHVTLPLPVIAYQPTKGLSVFSSSQFHHAPGGVYNGGILALGPDHPAATYNYLPPPAEITVKARRIAAGSSRR